MSFYTFAILKPDVLHRNLVGTVLSQIEAFGFKIVYAQMKELSEHEIKNLYPHHADKEYFPRIVRAMQWPSIGLILYSKDHTAEEFRDFAISLRWKLHPHWPNLAHNVIHASETSVDVHRESEVYLGVYPGCLFNQLMDDSTAIPDSSPLD